PRSAFEDLKEFPSVHSVTCAFGDWSLSFISEERINVEELKGFKKCILQEIKSATITSKVTTLDWDESMQKMHSMHPPQKKSSLKEKGFIVPWQEWEWALYREFRHNVRASVTDVLEKLGIPQSWYTRWVSSLSHFGNVQVTFYPLKVKKYVTYDFLFTSDYQNPLVDTLGLLPSASVFFSVGQYLLARISVSNTRETLDLYNFVMALKEKGFCTDFSRAIVVESKEWIP
ncbi:MAG: hypothetical protein HXS48_21220, partial [Theionarchaea archaeon]|nr:hypothetical protein [Theionarchaea archaeon]